MNRPQNDEIMHPNLLELETMPIKASYFTIISASRPSVVSSFVPSSRAPSRNDVTNDSVFTNTEYPGLKISRKT